MVIRSIIKYRQIVRVTNRTIGYNIFHKDRTGKIGGSVLVAIKSELEALHRPDLERPDCELVVVQIKNLNSKPVILYTFYRPPNSTHNSLNERNDSLQSNVEKDYVVVVGDFNLPELRWSEDQTTPNGSTGQTGELFCELFNDNFLQQHIVGSTHSGGNTLDLLLSNHPEVIHDVRSLSDEQFPSDHYPIEFFMKQTFKQAYHVRRRVYDFRRGQFQQLQTFLQRSPIEATFSGNIDKCWVQWKTQFQEAVHHFIPSKTIVDKNFPPSIDREVQHLIRKKYTELKKYHLNKCETRKQNVRAISQKVKNLIKRKHREYLKNIETSFYANPKVFWSYHKAMTHKRRDLNPFIMYNGVTGKTLREKAEIFNSYFSSAFQKSRVNLDNGDTDSAVRFPSDSELFEITVSAEEVISYLRNLDVNKSHGPDEIHPRLLKVCCEQIRPSLCTLFNHSINCGRVPTEWKSANITPVHKKESKELAENYRPISLLSIVSKTLERCVSNNLYHHVSGHISDEQHGFVRNRSCVTQLLSVFHTIGENLDKNIQTDILYLDFAKAFDSVDHCTLLVKLKVLWSDRQIAKLVRLQRVVVDGVAFQWMSVTSGVPQGSILGPLLFAIFINDFPDVVKDRLQTALYADDSKIYESISSIQCCETLQHSLDSLNTWSYINNMSFNASKCKVLTVTRKLNPVNFDYHLEDKTLAPVRKEKISE